MYLINKKLHILIIIIIINITCMKQWCIDAYAKFLKKMLKWGKSLNFNWFIVMLPRFGLGLELHEVWETMASVALVPL